MAEALADVALATTIATAEMQTTSENKQQTTNNNRLWSKPCLVMVMTEVALWR
jgi:hypothetical protein